MPIKCALTPYLIEVLNLKIETFDEKIKKYGQKNDNLNDQPTRPTPVRSSRKPTVWKLECLTNTNNK